MTPADAPENRPARPEDEPALLGLMRDFYAEEHLVFDELIGQRTLRELLTHPQFGLVRLIESAGAPVGYFALTFGFSAEFHGRYALLDELYLIPPVRGRGWGRQCIALAGDLARHEGIAALRLEVNHANAHARAVYLKAGFQDNRRDLFTQWLASSP